MKDTQAKIKQAKATSKKQVKANRQNAQKSTGPSTPAGKSVVKFNALKHGLASAPETALLPIEDAKPFRTMKKALMDDLRPVGVMENMCVDQMAAGYWKLARLQKIETGIMFDGLFRDRSKVHRENSEAYVFDLADSLSSGQVQEQYRSEYNHEISEATKADETADISEWAGCGRAFSRNLESFKLLSRYETTIFRNILRAFHELERLQSIRKNAKNAVSVP